jgi:hypothetical protein
MAADVMRIHHREALQTLTATGPRRSVLRLRYNPRTMPKTVAEALTDLDSLRERLAGASERLSWLRSYL